MQNNRCFQQKNRCVQQKNRCFQHKKRMTSLFTVHSVNKYNHVSVCGHAQLTWVNLLTIQSSLTRFVLTRFYFIVYNIISYSSHQYHFTHNENGIRKDCTGRLIGKQGEASAPPPINFEWNVCCFNISENNNLPLFFFSF